MQSNFFLPLNRMKQVLQGPVVYLQMCSILPEQHRIQIHTSYTKTKRKQQIYFITHFLFSRKIIYISRTEIIIFERDQRRKFDKTEEGIYVARLLLQKVIGFFSELRCSSRRLALNTLGKALMWRFREWKRNFVWEKVQREEVQSTPC